MNLNSRFLSDIANFYVSDKKISIFADTTVTYCFCCQVNVYINVTDLNDNSPVFYPSQYYAQIPESSGLGYSILPVTATDLDAGDNGVVRYGLSQQNVASSKFAIDRVSGLITLTGSLPVSQRSYTFQVCHGADGYPEKFDSYSDIICLCTAFGFVLVQLPSPWILGYFFGLI